MKAKTSTLGVLLAGALLLGASAMNASELDRAMEPILDEYLTIQRALAADRTEGIAGAVQVIEKRAKQLQDEVSGKEHTKHYQSISADILAACRELDQAGDIAGMREAFKELSEPVALWVTMAEPEGKSVMYCSMAKASWVQEGAEPANPYFGSAMHGCGEKVGGAD